MCNLEGSRQDGGGSCLAAEVMSWPHGPCVAVRLSVCLIFTHVYTATSCFCRIQRFMLCFCNPAVALPAVRVSHFPAVSRRDSEEVGRVTAGVTSVVPHIGVGSDLTTLFIDCRCALTSQLLPRYQQIIIVIGVRRRNYRKASSSPLRRSHGYYWHGNGRPASRGAPRVAPSPLPGTC